MASSYTGNSGIEKPGDGDQSGSWGDTINTNMDIIDRSINGVGAITLSGTTHTLTTTDGTLSDGMYKVLVLGGSPSGTNTITIAPNDADKVYIVVNSSGQTATFTQGSGANVSVLNGDSKIIYADGAGSGAAVVDITANLSFSSVNIDGGTIDGTVIGGASAAAGTFTTVTASGEIDGASLDISGNADIDGTLETDALSIASTTVTSTAAELNYNDTGAAVGTVVASKTVTADANKDVASFRNITLTGELDAGSLDISGDADIDGTLETDALSIASTAVTATAAEINYLDITTLGTSEASKAVTVDSSGDLIVPDSDKFKFGAGSDMQLYHDGTNSYITNGTGILKIATETSGIALTIGHTTSEVTFGDNVTVTGDFTVNGTTTTINTTNLTVTDPLVKYGQGYTGTAYDEGFIVTRGNGSASNTANKGFIWDESADEFAAIACNTEDGTTAGNVTINSYADLQIDKLTAGSLDISGDADIDGTLEADAMTLNGTAITATATLSTGISNTNVPVFTSGVADDDFLRVAGTSIEGRSAAEVLSDIGASAVAGSSSIVTTGALNSGSITSGFGSIDNGSSAITTTGVITGGTVEATTDTAAGDNAAIGYTSAEGLILTGQGSTSDVTIKNDADATVLSIPTGTTKVGIGTTAAAVNLHVASGADGIAARFSRTSGGGIVDVENYNGIGGIGTSDNIPFRFNTNNTERVRITNDGKIGIGTTAPSALVEIDGTGTDDFLVIKTTEASANSAPDVVLYRLSSSPADDDFLGKFVFRGRNDNTQDVTYSQIVSQAIDVSDGSEDGRLYLQTKVAGSDINHITLDADGIKLENNVVVVGTARRITGDFSNATLANRVAFQTSTADASTIVNVITNGTGSFSGLRVFNNSSTTNASYGTFAASGSTAVEVKSERSGSGTYLPLDFYTSGSTRMRILADGKVGIGTSAPDSLVEISSGGATTAKVSTSATNSYAEWIYEDGNAGYGFQVRSDGAQSIATGSFVINDRDTGSFPVVINEGNATNTLFISGSNVLIQSATNYSDGSIGNGCFQLDGLNGARIGMTCRAKNSDGSAFVTSATGLIGFVNGNGAVGNISTDGSATIYNTSSDYRLKENVSYTFDATTRLKQLKPARFNFKADADKTVDGFLAHEVSSIVPEAITGTKDAVADNGDPIYQCIDQSKLVPLLVKTIQELEARITALEAR